MGEPSTTPADGTAPRRKAVLFCPECSHESPPDGDWRRRRSAGAVSYVCPECRAEVTRRPADGAAPGPGRGTGLPWGTGLVVSTTELVTTVWRSTRHLVAGWMRSA